MNLLKKALGVAIMMAMPLYVFAQNITVGGVVKDEAGLAVIGASVIQQGTTNGVITDVDGNYSISVPSNASLQFSSIGYKDQLIPVDGKNKIDVVMQEDKELLEEVVVIGYGVQKKSDVTGAIASINEESLQNRSVDNVASAFAGKTAGVVVLSNSGDPSSMGTIRVRGVSSNSSGSSDPLYIVDGLQVSSLNAVDPQNVKSIEILKDAASAAIYGAQAGNGVVVITTKTGEKTEKGFGSVFYNGSYTIQKLGWKPQMMNAEQYIDYFERNGELVQTLVDQYWDGKTDTDWFDAILPGGYAHRHTVGARGANDKGSYYFSLSYLYNDGIIVGKQDDFTRLNFQLNADYQIKKWLKLGTTNTFQTRNQSYVLGSMGGGDGSIMNSVYSLDPLTPPTCTESNMPSYMRTLIDNGFDVMKTPEGEYITTSQFNERTSNPLIGLYRYPMSMRKNIDFNGTVYANVTPFKGFTFTSRFGYSVNSYQTKRFEEPWYANPQLFASEYRLEDNVGWSVRFQWENFVNYTHTFAKKHRLDAMAGISYINYVGQNVSATTDGLSDYKPNFLYLAYSNKDAVDTVDGTTDRSASISYFARLGYSYDNRYFIQASFRADAFDSSKLSPKNRWGYFPSVSLGWTITNESWMKNVSRDAISFAKLRASWGINGNVAVLYDYQYASTVVVGGDRNHLAHLGMDAKFTNAAFPNKLSNDKLSWESSQQIDIGLDTRFLRDRLTFSADYYIKNTNDLLVSIKPSYITGHESVMTNSGSVQNKGIEFDLGWKDSVGNFNYSISGNIAHNKNMVTYLDPTITFINGTKVNNVYYATRFQEGYPVWYMYGSTCEGINPEDGSPIYKMADPDKGLQESDRGMIGSAMPKFTYGITLNAEWKGIDLTVFGSGSYGNSIWFAGVRTDFVGRNMPAAFYTDGWKNPGDQAKYPSPKYAKDTEYLSSSAVVFDGSYFRINQIQLGYTLPKKWLDAIKFSNIRIYASLDDFFTFSKYIGFDPSVAGDNNGEGRGIDRGTYPTAKRIMFGINLTL